MITATTMRSQSRLRDEEVDANRFTIADYYDHEPEAYMLEDAPKRGESSKAALPSQSGYPAEILAPAPAVVNPRKQGSTATTMSTSTSGLRTKAVPMTSSGSHLRLHQPEERPVFHASTLTTSPDHPLSPADSIREGAMSAASTTFDAISPSSSHIRPLPSIPRSQSSSGEGHTGDRYLFDGSTVSPTSPTTTSSRIPLSTIPSSHSLSLNALPPSGVDHSPALSPPILEHRKSTRSGHSGLSNGWEDRSTSKEKDFDFAIAPALNISQSSGTPKVQRWYQRVFPTSTACRLLLFTVVLESIIDLAIEVSPGNLVHVL
jgi:hypothetical protein